MISGSRKSDVHLDLFPQFKKGYILDLKIVALQIWPRFQELKLCGRPHNV